MNFDLSWFYSLSRSERGRVYLKQGFSPMPRAENVFVVPSQFVRGRKYRVIENYDKWVCTCADYHYRKHEIGECKHIKAVKFWRELKEYLHRKGEFVGTEQAVPSCFYCSSMNVIKRGKRKNKGVQRQRFYCKDCKKYFVADKEFQRIKVNPKIATLCLDLYFKGLSLRKVKDTLEQFYGNKISHETVRHYISVFMECIEKNIKELKPQGCECLHSDEMLIKESGKWKYLWNTIDSKTRFLLASTITNGRSEKQAVKHFKEVKKFLPKKPSYIITDGYMGYHGALKKEFKTVHSRYKNQIGTRHIRSIGFFKNQRIERLHNSQKERLKVMRGFNGCGAKQMRNWKNYYNFIRPHQGLNGKTPAQQAGIELGLNGNKWKGLIES